MIDTFYELSRNFLKNSEFDYKRYLVNSQFFNHRCVFVLGQRGIGKTTAILQYLISLHNANKKCRQMYVPADHFLVGNSTLYEIADEFQKAGGITLCIDEVHKYDNWSEEVKSIYDTFPKLQLILSGSAALEIRKGSHDLSRRAVIVKMKGMSLREYCELSHQVKLPSFSFDQILREHSNCAEQIIDVLDKNGLRILPLFNEYLVHGYYPFFFSTSSTQVYHQLVEQGIHASIECDLIAVQTSLNGESIRRIKKLLSILSMSVPFTPDIRKLKIALDIGDERTLKTYFTYLDSVGVITLLSNAGGKIRSLAKPGKILLNNSNQMYALLGSNAQINRGTLRETFFVNMIKHDHEITIPSSGDFCLDDSMVFEIGGKSKTFKQVANLDNAWCAIDEIEVGSGRRIPLWLFGFMY